jgi:hypothetical protein
LTCNGFRFKFGLEWLRELRHGTRRVWRHAFVEEIGWAFDAEGAAIHDV